MLNLPGVSLLRCKHTMYDGSLLAGKVGGQKVSVKREYWSLETYGDSGFIAVNYLDPSSNSQLTCWYKSSFESNMVKDSATHSNMLS